ncbi:hypothetical protein EPUS_08966 [Endocarpon pusillum Z07020]|uniref:UDP-N-acetylglucosamine transferase subunit ALG14 n=1 Tax=Endocarpon pusillum (strain Z07020 / HMAS-L-300199) TaxID=1263415 RepID=U1HZC7_ENDPU|nr:uncharacterized protein EPUS_08966 [Endocarpon pusillum Z07020]ERF74914.1 hypothetical protein EPUS_08966 [Endocarpon pusillum Z07020]
MSSPYSRDASRSYLIPLILGFLSILITISILTLTRLLTILVRPRATSLGPTRPTTSSRHPTHLLIVLGSGGHTAEMLNMLRCVPLLSLKFTYRTYVVSSGDGFSALKAREFEMEIAGHQADPAKTQEAGEILHTIRGSYDIVAVRRARRVHQSLFSTPWTASLCVWDCIRVIMDRNPRRTGLPPHQSCNIQNPGYPDLILTNGPGTGVCVVLASLIVLFFGFSGPASSTSGEKFEEKPDRLSRWQQSGQMRTIFIESWARVKTLSLSGKILLPFVDRFLVQWPALEGKGGGKAEFVGALVA